MPRPAGVVTPGARFIVLASICIIVGALYFMQDVLIPLALAILVSFLLAPVINRLERAGLHRVPAVALVMTVVLLLVVILGYVVSQQVLDLARDLPNYRDSIVQKVTSLRPSGESSFEKAARTIQEVQTAVVAPATTQAAPTTLETQIGITRGTDVPVDTMTPEAEAAVATRSALPGTSKDKPIWTTIVESPTPLEVLGDYVAIVGAPLGTAGIVIVFVIFILLQREDLRDRFIRLVGHGQLNITTSALDDATTRISRYLVAQAIVNGTYGVAVAIALWLIGITLGDKTFPNFVLWGLLCALLRFIPYIGPWIAAAFPILVSFAMFPGYGVFLATGITFVIIELISNNVMEPMLYGSSTGMSAIAVLISAVFWTFLWGPIGLLLATPLTVCIVVLGKYVPQLRFLDIMLGDEPVLTPPERLYQRLLALDEEEAHDLAEEMLDDVPLEQVYDQMLMPALAMAEQDRHRGRLDDRRQAFIRRVMREIIDDLGDEQRQRDEKAADARAKAEAAERSDDGKPAPTGAEGNGKTSATKTTDQPAARARLPDNCTINIVCLPARDESDEICGLMLAQLLNRLGYCARPLSVTSLASEMLDAVDRDQAHIVCVSAMPPAAVAHARYLCKRVHQRHPKMTMVVGLWNYKGDLKRARARTTCVGADEVVTTLAGALDEIHERAQPLITAARTSSVQV